MKNKLLYYKMFQKIKKVEEQIAILRYK